MIGLKKEKYLLARYKIINSISELEIKLWSILEAGILEGVKMSRAQGSDLPVLRTAACAVLTVCSATSHSPGTPGHPCPALPLPLTHLRHGTRCCPPLCPFHSWEE